jgi:hypothetical protein
MSFLRRLFGGDERSEDELSNAGGEPAPDDASGKHPGPPSATDLVAEEQARERELLRADAQRLSDDLIQRQMRYADRAWTPPAQGGSRRADDEEAAAE